MIDPVKLLQGMLGVWREPIPVQFHQTFQGRPFATCSFCAQPLLAPWQRYTIRKHMLGGQLRQEVAMCLTCRGRLRSGVSQASREAGRSLFPPGLIATRVEILSRIEKELDRAARLTAHCLFCQAERTAAYETVEIAYCEADEIVYYMHPYLVCVDCLVALESLLSEETREHRRRFLEEHYGFPPPAPAGREARITLDALLD